MRKSFTVFGVKVPIKYFDNSSHNDLMGYCTHNPIEIFINKDLSPDDKRSTLSHELIHAVIFRLGLDQNLSKEMQEILAESIGELITKEFTPKRGKK